MAEGDESKVAEMREERLKKTIRFYSGSDSDNTNMPSLDADFSKSVGGSAVEMRTEKQFGALLRGEDKDGDVATMPTYPDEDDGSGKWVKFMSSRGCFAFAHSITCEVLFSKPDDYESDDEAKAGGEGSCILTEMPDQVDKIISGGKTPLIIDPSADGLVRTFYEYKASLLDLQEVFKGPVLGGLPAKDAMEVARQALVAAMKGGNTLVLYFGRRVPKLQAPKKFSNPTKFPLEIFEAGSMNNPKIRKRLYKRDDKVGGMCPIKEGFKVVVVTSFGEDEYVARLKKQLPFQHLQPLVVTP